MFAGMFPRKPSKEEAMKQLRSHATYFGAWVLVLRVTPHLLNYFQKEELHLDL
ncbi:mitochondrial import receptor subunit TOM6 homolog [Silene latifolia]|uniref:mitochondrial import receptor subunit TOM6 homolog n=1 Tax=Silene latifolia TaxID=37657 RepID=UPI003D772870